MAHEGSDMTVYEVGHDMKASCNFLESYDMTLEATVTKMMWAMGQTKDREIFEELFYRTINHDLMFV